MQDKNKTEICNRAVILLLCIVQPLLHCPYSVLYCQILILLTVRLYTSILLFSCRRRIVSPKNTSHVNMFMRTARFNSRCLIPCGIYYVKRFCWGTNYFKYTTCKRVIYMKQKQCRLLILSIFSNKVGFYQDQMMQATTKF